MQVGHETTYASSENRILFTIRDLTKIMNRVDKIGHIFRKETILKCSKFFINKSFQRNIDLEIFDQFSLLKIDFEN